MEMEVWMPVPATDFNFDSSCSSPYITAPSSPQRFGNFFFSAPTSPSRSPFSFYGDLNNHLSSSSTKLFDAQQQHHDGDDEDFEFNFSGQLEPTSLSADELFDGGKIRPLKPPSSTYESASTIATVSLEIKDPEEDNVQGLQRQRGRERVSISSCSRKGTRSLSPMRVSDIIYQQDDEISPTAKFLSSRTDNNNNNNNNNNSTKSYAASILSAISFSKSYKKWKLKDLLLFRSASEGRATGQDALRKYSVLSKTINKEPEDVKNASFRSTDSSGSISRRRGPVSAHELHYTAKRAVSEELKRKTFLPYKQGLLGCLGFNPGMHDISRGVGSLPRG